MAQYIAHIRQSDSEVQLLSVHLNETRQIAELIGEKIGIPHVTGLAALLHDMGKYSDDFQLYIFEAFNNPHHPPKRGSVNHSTAGARYLIKNYHMKYKAMIECVANSIYSHHGQLLDMVDNEGKSPFQEREVPRKFIDFSQVENRFFGEVMEEQQLQQYIEVAQKEFLQFLQRYVQKDTEAQDKKKNIRTAVTFLTKYIFSTLIDADRTNSRQFDERESSNVSLDEWNLFREFSIKLSNSLKEKQMNSIQNNITMLRREMSDTCFEKASLDTGIYKLSIPTGGGKTLASLRFALQHALLHKKKRIVYIVPYTTIIEQNAQEVREILGAHDYVLEHHSNVVEERELEEDNINYNDLEARRKWNNAKDNWDAPIIFTTMVQYLDTFYSGKSRNERRLHNLSNAIIIFDEVQSVPVNCISLFNETLNFLSKGCYSTILLCTATQPALEYVQHNIKVDGELIDRLDRVIEAFKRTEIIPLLKQNGWTTEQIGEFIKEQLNSVRNILIIMNNKSVVKRLYEYIKDYNASIFHLSTNMCPAHRKDILKKMRTYLKEGKSVICISTQLIEAGVDVSFQCVIRSLAGLDSIAQAAGRCNRNGEVPFRNVYIINHAEEYLKSLVTIEKGRECSSRMLHDLQSDEALYGGYLLSEKALSYYFRLFYEKMAPTLNYQIKGTGESMFNILFTNNPHYIEEYKGNYPYWSRASFKTAARNFEVIEANTKSVVVPYGKGEQYIAHLLSGEKNSDYTKLLKDLQQYTVNVFSTEYSQLINNGLISIIDFGFIQICIAKQIAYEDAYGLNSKGEATLDDLIF